MRELALVTALVLASGRVHALGLGDIELHSALNEPLNAEVLVLSEQPDELTNAVARLASADDFSRAGIERPSLLSDINFTIVRRKDGAAIVKITSTQPIREPFLDFIVQLRWQSGRLLREYTVLLDPPVFGEEKAAPVSAPVTEQTPPPQQASAEPGVMAPAPISPSAPVPEPVTTEPREPLPTATTPPAPIAQAPRRQMTAPAAASDMSVKHDAQGKLSYGPTRRNETLWNIASNMRTDDSISVYQMMIALLKNNPQAFYDDNINNLKAGYVLRIPEKSQIASVSHGEAMREAARQYDQWRQAKRGIAGVGETRLVSPDSTDAQTQAASPSTEAVDKDVARLRLVAPTEGASPSSAGTQAQLEKLRSELAMALETSDAAKRESEELRARVAALEQQINSVQRLLTLKDEALSEMQKRSGVQVPESAEMPGPGVEPPPVTAPAPPQPAQTKPAPAKPAPQAAEEPAPDLFANPMLIGALAGAGLLLFSVVWLVVRRRRGSAEETAQEPPAATGDTPTINLELAPEEPEPEEEVFDSHMTQVAEEEAQRAESGVVRAGDDLEVRASSEGDIDPIVEADVYLAYRRYQQAEALVQSALEKQPHRQDLQGKLLEIHYAAKNADAFQAQALALYDSLEGNAEDPLWQKILPMGRELCPDHELFMMARGLESSSEDAFGDEVSRAPVADVGQDFPAEAEGAAPGVAGEESLDLSIGGGVNSATPNEDSMDLNLGGKSEASAESLGSALDFDGIPAAEDSKEAMAASLGDQASSAKSDNTWDIESAASDFGNLDFGLDDSDLLAGTDVVGTKLDLARAYIDMGDNESAHDILKEVLDEGSEQQKQEAKSLMEKSA